MSYYTDGWADGSVLGAGTITLTNGSATATLSSSTDASAIANGDVLIVVINSTYAYYPALVVSSGGGTTTLTLIAEFSGTTGAYSFFYVNYPRELFNVTSYRRTLESPSDTIGLPTQRWNKTLAFDVEGVVMKISVEGFMYDTLTNIVSYQNTLDSKINGNQMNLKPTWIWYSMEPSNGGYKAYPIHFTKIEYAMEPKLKTGANSYYRLNYKLECVCRDPAQI